MTRSLYCRSFLGSLPLTIFNFEEGERFYFLVECLLFFHYFYTIFHYFGFSLICSLSYFFAFLSSFFSCWVLISITLLCLASYITTFYSVLPNSVQFNSASHFASHSTPHPSGNRCLRFSYIVFSI